MRRASVTRARHAARGVAECQVAGRPVGQLHQLGNPEAARQERRTTSRLELQLGAQAEPQIAVTARPVGAAHERPCGAVVLPDELEGG